MRVREWLHRRAGVQAALSTFYDRELAELFTRPPATGAIESRPNVCYRRLSGSAMPKASLGCEAVFMPMSHEVRSEVDRVLTAWASVRQEVAGSSANACISATGASHEVLKGAFQLDVSPLAVDLARVAPGSEEAVVVVAHPESGSAIDADGYHGHVVLVLTEAGNEYVVDADLGLVARLQDGNAVAVAPDKVKYIYTARPQAVEFLDTDAWKGRAKAAHLLATAIDQDGDDTAL